MANYQGPDGQWYFDAGGMGWKNALAVALKEQRDLLTGASFVLTPNDSRLCLACTSREARGRLLKALRAVKGMVAHPQLGESARDNKQFA